MAIFKNAILTLLLFGLTKAENKDEVTSMPGLKFKPPFRHYSGYLQADEDVFLHYWLFESQHNVTTDPLFVWFNGGPGSSSLLGALTEHGPFRIDSDETILLDPWAWNKQASALYIESPAGVGFSFKLDKNYTTDDDLVAKRNLEALRSFFKKYPNFEKNDFYITGESYGGIYVPVLTSLALDNKYPKNLKGFIIGNGCIDWELNDNSRMHYLYHHGLINDDEWEQLKNECCPGNTNARKCNFYNSTKECSKHIEDISDNLENLLDVYNIYGACFNEQMNFNQLSTRCESREPGWGTGCLLRNYHKNSKQMLPCVDYQALRRYLKRQDVRVALHIDPRAPVWDLHFDKLPFKYTYHSTIKHIKKMLAAGLKGLIYNGDFDTICNYLGDRWLVEEFGYKLDGKYEPWYHNKRVGGYQLRYGKLLYQTVFAAGHMVPMDQPGSSLTMFNEFLKM